MFCLDIADGCSLAAIICSSSLLRIGVTTIPCWLTLMGESFPFFWHVVRSLFLNKSGEYFAFIMAVRCLHKIVCMTGKAYFRCSAVISVESKPLLLFHFETEKSTSFGVTGMVVSYLSLLYCWWPYLFLLVCHINISYLQV